MLQNLNHHTYIFHIVIKATDTTQWIIRFYFVRCIDFYCKLTVIAYQQLKFTEIIIMLKT